jgi:hypothetical protein
MFGFLGDPPPEGLEHAKLFPPSGGKRWMYCTASPMLVKDKPNSSSAFAAEGSAAHWVSEQALKENSDTLFFAGKVYHDGKYSITVDAEMVKHTQNYVDYVYDLPGELIGVEVKINLSELMGVADQFGTADAIKYDPQEKTLHVIDLKYGKGVKVFAEKNEQGLIYGSGAYLHLRKEKEIEKLRIHICQPRLNHWDSWELPI